MLIMYICQGKKITPPGGLRFKEAGCLQPFHFDSNAVDLCFKRCCVVFPVEGPPFPRRGVVQDVRYSLRLGYQSFRLFVAGNRAVDFRLMYRYVWYHYLRLACCRGLAPR